MKKQILVLAVSLFGLSLHAQMSASCYMPDKGGAVQGVHLDTLYPIASVSKVVTSYWAVKRMGFDGRFKTAISIKPVAGGKYDVHLTGSRDPYYGTPVLKYFSDQLKAKGVTKIQNLTFDENFKFLASVRSSAVAEGNYGLNSPSSNRVMTELRSAANSLGLKIDNIEFKANADFDRSTFESSFLYQSSPLHVLLKEMNRNSNNHAANEIFQSLGGAGEFADFIKKELNLDGSDISFVNGSGDRLDLDNGSSVYNRSSCRSLLLIIQAFRKTLTDQKHSLQEVMAVAGDDSSDGRSTVSSIYTSDVTTDSLIAKTGTVNPSVALAGTISTEDGDIDFGYIYGTKGTVASWRDGRAHIRTELLKLYKQFGGAVRLHFHAGTFSSFDSASAFTKISSETLSVRVP